MKATPEERVKYEQRSDEYLALSEDLEAESKIRRDPQVRALAGTYAAECRELAKRWAAEERGGL